MEQTKEPAIGSMKSTLLSIISILCCGAYSVSCSSLAQPPPSAELHVGNQGSDVTALSFVGEIQKKNAQHALELFQALYHEYAMDFVYTSDDQFDDTIIGAQAGYYGEIGTEDEYSVLVRYGRIWTYDAAIGLSLAIDNEDPTADKRALWLLKNVRYIPDPENPESTLFAGWPFSMNLAHRGDNWQDRRFVTGANTFALIGLADYISSDFYKNLSQEAQHEFSDFFADALKGILYHFETDGPNEGLVTAGWTINALNDFAETNYSYYEILDIIGYEVEGIDGYPKTIETIRAENVVTEHCNDVLKLLNVTLAHFDSLFGFENAPYAYEELDAIRLKLRDSTLNKLFNEEQRRMIAGRTVEGIPSKFTAIDSASWLALSLNLAALNAAQVEMLSGSLVYTIGNFTDNFVIRDTTYFGAHYYPNGFEDTYVEKSTPVYHTEATCGLICGLLKFVEAFPKHPSSPFFRDVAVKLWVDMQYFVEDFGFIYSATSEDGVYETKEASVSTIWYLMTLKYFEEGLDR